MLRSYPAKQGGAVSSVVLGTQIALCIPFVPACAISTGLQLGNHNKKTKVEILNPVQFRRAKTEVSCFVSSYPEFYLLIFSKAAAAVSAVEEADVHGMGACAGITPQQPE